MVYLKFSVVSFVLTILLFAYVQMLKICFTLIDDPVNLSFICYLIAGYDEGLSIDRLGRKKLTKPPNQLFQARPFVELNV